jgi:hypothetical protein
MDLERLYTGSFVDWEAVAGSWGKRTVSSRLLLFAARRYLVETVSTAEAGKVEASGTTPLPDEIKQASSPPPNPPSPHPGTGASSLMRP